MHVVGYNVFNPNGVAGCSHRWSAAQPVEAHSQNLCPFVL
jgi:hypothetical protein